MREFWDDLFLTKPFRKHSDCSVQVVRESSAGSQRPKWLRVTGITHDYATPACESGAVLTSRSWLPKGLARAMPRAVRPSDAHKQASQSLARISPGSVLQHLSGSFHLVLTVLPRDFSVYQDCADAGRQLLRLIIGCSVLHGCGIKEQ